MVNIETQISAINVSIRDAQHEAASLQREGDEYEAGELLQRVEYLRDAIKSLEVLKSLKELMQ